MKMYVNKYILICLLYYHVCILSFNTNAIKKLPLPGSTLSFYDYPDGFGHTNFLLLYKN